MNRRPLASLITVASRGWNSSQPAETQEEVNSGIGCYWVEVDGVRLSGVISVVFEAKHNDFDTLTIRLCGPVKLVYVDKNGEVLPGGESRQPMDFPEQLAAGLEWTL